MEMEIRLGWCVQISGDGSSVASIFFFLTNQAWSSLLPDFFFLTKPRASKRSQGSVAGSRLVILLRPIDTDVLSHGPDGPARLVRLRLEVFGLACCWMVRSHSAHTV